MTLRSPNTWLAVAIIAAIFALDLAYPEGFAARLLYVGVILFGLWSPRRSLSLILAGVCTGLSVLGFVTASRVSQPAAAYFNLGVSILVFWVTGAGVARYRWTGAALRQSTKDLDDIKRALDQSAIVATTNVKGDITYVNDKFCEISKYTRPELLGANHRILNSGLHTLEFFKDMYATIGRGRVWRGDIRNRAKDGSLYWVDTTVVPFLDDRRRPYQYIAIRYDITERKASEAALRAQEALAQLGKMAAVVAHEVRNPLAGIRGALQVIGKRLPDGGREQAIAGEIVTRIDTLNEIVTDLLQFARPREPVLADVQVDSMIQETISLLHEDPQLEGVRIDVQTAGVTVRADLEQVKRAVLNLLMNSAQAMQGHGRIDITARKDGRDAELRIVDQGPGIPQAVRDHLFEPFFTTKHRGTGLGLATARQILQAHGGTIELHCPADGGTVAVLRLPLASAPEIKGSPWS